MSDMSHVIAVQESFIFFASIFLVALLYSSVGHGGASGYLAMMSFFHYLPSQMAVSALCLNLLVAGVSSIMFWKSKHFRWNLFWPFAASSIPFAWAGGMIRLSPNIYSAILAFTLLFAALRLSMNAKPPNSNRLPQYFIFSALLLGAVVGLLSGLVGVGGGIFLSPLLILMGWADAKEVAAISAPFIWVNSTAGLYGHISRSGLNALELWPFALIAFAGGCIGSYAGATKFNSLTLRRVLAVVLLTASYKLFLRVFPF